MRWRFRAPSVLACLLSGAAVSAAGETQTVKVGLREHGGDAKVTVAAAGRHRARIDVDPGTARQPLTVRVELRETGRGTWPAEDVQVVDAQGRPVPIRRNGVSWHRFSMTVPSEPQTYVVHAVDPLAGKPRPRLPSEAERTAVESETGLAATLSKWYDGRRAALCIRFDDSHPTHLSAAIPILREHGLRATFMINPGNAGYTQNKEAWEACAKRGDQEFANHTLHHRGAANAAEIDREVGDVSKCIWRLFPHRSKLVALNRGGGTTWETTRPFRQWLDKYHLFHVTGSLGMDDVYGNRVAAFRQHVTRNIQRGGWCKVHFHSIGKGLATSEEHFRAAVEFAKQHESDLWIAGLADAYKYMVGRRAAKLALASIGSDRVELRLSCATDPKLYDQPLTIEATLPDSWSADGATVTGRESTTVAVRRASASGRAIIRFDVPPVDATYIIAKKP